MKRLVILILVALLMLAVLPAGSINAGETTLPQGKVMCGTIRQGELLYPQGIFVNNSGEIFVVDQGNSRIQVFDKKGKFLRMFGGKEYLYRPLCVAELKNGNIIVTDSYNQATTGSGIAIFSKEGKFIKKINSFSKDGSEEFNAPTGIAVDSEGNIFISDTGNNRVVVLNENLNFVKQIGNGVLSSPTGIAVDDKYIYVSDFGNNRIAIFSKTSGKLVNSITQFTLRRNVGFNAPLYKTFSFEPSPMGIAVDGNGNIYFIDAKEKSILIFDSSLNKKGSIERFGMAEGEFVMPRWIAFSNNSLYITDEKLSRVLIFDTNGNYKSGIYSALFSPNSVSQPTGISSDNKGNIYICDEASSRILKLDKNLTPKDMDFSNSEIPFKNQEKVGDIGQLSFIFYPQKIQIDDSGNIYVLDWGAVIKIKWGGLIDYENFPRILVFNSELKYQKTIFCTENLSYANDFLVKDGNLFITSLYGIYKLDFNGKILAKNQSGVMDGIAKDEEGNIYTTNESDSTVNVFDSNLKLLKKIGKFGCQDGGIAYPRGVAVASNGDIYVADTGNSRIAVFDKSGNYKFAFGGFGTENNEFVNPIRIFIKGKNVYVSDPYASTVKMFTLKGDFEQYICSDKFFTGRFVYPGKIAANSKDMVAILDGYSGRVYLYKNDKYLESFNIYPDYSKRFSAFIKENELTIGDITLGEDGSVYVLNGDNETITRFYNNGISAEVDTRIEDFHPSAIAISKSGMLYIASLYENKILYGRWIDGNFYEEGEIDLSEFKTPNGNSIYPSSIFVRNDSLYIADSTNFAVYIINLQTKNLASISIEYPESEMSSTPEGVTVDDNGNIYVCNTALARIEVYDKNGKLLYKFGRKGGPLMDASVLNDYPDATEGYVGYFLYPSGIAFSDDKIYVADPLNKRIQEFGLGSGSYPETGSPSLAAKISERGVNLYWIPVKDNRVKGYAIFRSEDNSFNEIASISVNATSYMDAKVKNGTIYKYIVRTVFEDGTISLPTNEIDIKVHGVVEDTTSPNLQIISPQNYTTVNEDTVDITGKVIDDGSGVESVTVDGNAVTTNDDGTFSTTVSLMKGDNIITIVATDKAGNKTTKTITVTYKPQIIITLQPNNPTMTVNGVQQEIDPGRGTKPVIIPKWNRTVVPIRAIVEALGGTIGWDPIQRMVTINLDDNTINLWIGKPQAEVNGIMKWIDPNNHDVKPIIVNSRTMLPLRFVAESLGCKVDWDAATRTITITYTP